MNNIESILKEIGRQGYSIVTTSNPKLMEWKKLIERLGSNSRFNCEIQQDKPCSGDQSVRVTLKDVPRYKTIQEIYENLPINKEYTTRKEYFDTLEDWSTILQQIKDHPHLVDIAATYISDKHPDYNHENKSANCLELRIKHIPNHSK